MSVDFFEEGKKRRFMSCDKAENELLELIDMRANDAGGNTLISKDFWEGYRWHEPEVKQKVNKK